MAVEPKGHQRFVEVTARRTKIDFVDFVRHLVEEVYASAKSVHLVLDNLNTHFQSSFEEVMGPEAANAFLQRVVFHYTPKHASWLNMAEIEIGILDRQCLDRRIQDRATLSAKWPLGNTAAMPSVAASIGHFTRQDADNKLGRHYVS